MKSLLHFLIRKKSKNKGQAAIGYKKRSCGGFFTEGARKSAKIRRMKIGGLDEFLKLEEPICRYILLAGMKIWRNMK